MSKEAMKLALLALEQYTNVVASVNNPDAWVTVVDAGKPAREAIAALREALAEQKSGIKQVIELYDSPDQPAQQDPFIYYRHYDGGTQDFPDEKTIPLYTSPPAQRTWVGLTDEERIMCRSYDPEEAVAKTEAKLKEKNT